MSLLLRYGVKFGGVAGAVYYSNEIGLWGDSAQAYELYKKGYQFAAPYVSDVKKEIPLPDIQLPSTECASRTAKNYWNKGVVKTIDTIIHVPHYIKEYGSEAYVYISQQLENAAPEEKN